MVRTQHVDGRRVVTVAVDVYTAQTPAVRSQLTIDLDGLPGTARPAYE